MKKIVVRDSESGYIIDEVASVEDGKELIHRYEQMDRNEGNYTPNFYEVAEVDEDTLPNHLRSDANRRFRIRPEFQESWGECSDDTIIDMVEVKRISAEWGKPVCELMKELDEI